MTPIKALNYLARVAKKNPEARAALRKFKKIGDDAANYTSKQLDDLKRTVNKFKKSIDSADPTIPGRKSPTSGIIVGKQRTAREIARQKVLKAAAGAAGAVGGAAVAAPILYNKGKKEGRKEFNQTADFAIEMTDREANTNKKSYGGKVTRRKAGGKIGRGCGAALRGGGKVMR
jgi:hypothetical protein|tara:strand:- start:697 stop:1218 length:522 start_codon:yes stop_codon:yes gene_type:complete